MLIFEMTPVIYSLRFCLHSLHTMLNVYFSVDGCFLKINVKVTGLHPIFRKISHWFSLPLFSCFNDRQVRREMGGGSGGYFEKMTLTPGLLDTVPQQEYSC